MANIRLNILLMLLLLDNKCYYNHGIDDTITIAVSRPIQKSLYIAAV